MTEYIEREAAIEAVKHAWAKGLEPSQYIEIIPVADVSQVKHGRWERDEWGSYLRRCSVCKKSPIYKDERGNSVAVYAGVCINCGARMDGD